MRSAQLVIAALAGTAVAALAGPVQYTTTPGYNACSSACGVDVKYDFPLFFSSKKQPPRDTRAYPGRAARAARML